MPLKTECSKSDVPFACNFSFVKTVGVVLTVPAQPFCPEYGWGPSVRHLFTRWGPVLGICLQSEACELATFVSVIFEGFILHMKTEAVY